MHWKVDPCYAAIDFEFEASPGDSSAVWQLFPMYNDSERWLNKMIREGNINLTRVH